MQPLSESSTDSTSSDTTPRRSAKAQTRTKQAVEGHVGTKVMFFLKPEDITIDGLDNKREIDAYNAARIQVPLKIEDVYSIIQNGVLTPVGIHVRKTDDTREYPVDDGRQRTRRAREANRLIALHNSGKQLLPEHIAKPDQKLELVSVPCVPAKVSSDLDAVLKSIAANSGKLQDSPRDLANAVQWLYANGAGFEQIVKAVAKDTQTVRDYMNMGKASSKVLKALDEGLLSTHAACVLAQRPKDEQNKLLEEELEKTGGKKVSRDSAKAAVQRSKAEERGKPTKVKEAKRSVRDMRLVELGLVEQLGEVRKGTKEYEAIVFGITMLRFQIGEEYPDFEGAEKMYNTIFSALKAGPKLKKKLDEAKAAGGGEE